MRLEGLVLAAKTEQNGVLQIGRQDNVLVAGFTWQLHTQVPWSQSYKSEGRWGPRAGVFGDEVFVGVGVEAGDGVTEGASVLNVLPGQGGEGSTQRRDGSVDGADEHRLAVQL